MADLSELYSGIFGYISLPFPGLPNNGLNHFKDRIDVPGAVESVFKTMKGATPLGRPEIMPVSLRHPDINNGQFWKFPLQPLVTIQSANRIIRRFPEASGKLRGSVKESWNKDDSRITLEGVFMYQPANVHDERFDDQIATDLTIDINTLLRYEDKVVVDIENPKVNGRGITSMAIERVVWPSYSHHNVHPFRMTCFSDDSNYNLFD